MQQLVFIQHGKSFTTSLILSELFKKRHGNIVTHIRNMKCINGYKEANYILKHYINPMTGQINPYYLISRDGFGNLLTYFNWELIAAYSINVWDAFEQVNSHIRQLERERVTLEISSTGMFVRVI